MKKLLFAVSTLLALSATQASADECLYAGVFGGANWLNITDVKVKDWDRFNSGSSYGCNRKPKIKSDFDVGYIVGGAIGYRWCGGLRFEGEIAYRHNQLDKAHVKRRHGNSSDYWSNSRRKNRFNGNFRTVSVMANVLYDIPFDCSPVFAYVGGGIGYAHQKFSAHRKKQRDCSSSSSDYSCSDYSYSDYTYSDYSCSSYSRRCHRSNSKSSNGFAAQAIVGLGYNFCDEFDFTVEYRYLYVSKHAHSNNNSLVFGARTGF